MKLTIIAHKILNINLLTTITTIYLPKTIKTTNSYLMANIMRAIIKTTTKMELNIMIKRLLFLFKEVKKNDLKNALHHYKAKEYYY